MNERDLNRGLERWRDAGLLDGTTVARILEWEAQQAVVSHRSRFSRFAFAFGGLLLGAGILLFVAANWDQLSPAGRFVLLAATIAGLHASAALARSRLPALSTTLHAVGTAALGGGIFLAGQQFNLAAHWPEGFLLWGLGALAGVLLLRDWPQAVWLALLGPAWLVAEWGASDLAGATSSAPALVFVFLSCIAYLAGPGPGNDARWRHALAVVGAVMTVPVAFMLPAVPAIAARTIGAPAGALAVLWAIALGLPLLVGFWLRGRGAWPMLVAAVCAVLVVLVGSGSRNDLLVVHLLYAALAVGLVWWGVREQHRLRVNLGVLAFALNVLVFYYGSLFDRFGRSLGLIGLGLLFVVGGWWLERVRRRLVRQVEEARR